jgi:hypothetical protein
MLGHTPDRDRPLARPLDPPPDRRGAKAADVDRQLVVRAAREAARLAPASADWPADDHLRLVYGVALLALKRTLGAEAYAALHERFDANRAWFVERLAARLAADGA